MILDLTDGEIAALARLLSQTIGDDDRYPQSSRVRTMKAILAKIRLEPARAPPPPLKYCETPWVGAARSQRARASFEIPPGPPTTPGNSAVGVGLAFIRNVTRDHRRFCGVPISIRFSRFD
jgi:hypothetical protein